MSADNIGSSFDDYLPEEGILEECEARAIKEILALQVSSFPNFHLGTQLEKSSALIEPSKQSFWDKDVPK